MPTPPRSRRARAPPAARAGARRAPRRAVRTGERLDARARASGSFLYHRDDPRFEQVMAYYHTSVVGQRFRDLGLDTGAPVAIGADAVPQDNSFFSAATRSIVFGTGGIDDGEDGGVIAHEYGHALQSVYAPGFPVSEQGMAVAEGFADYVAARHVEDATGDARRALCLFAWDARGLGADCARRLDGHLVYPRDLTGSSTPTAASGWRRSGRCAARSAPTWPTASRSPPRPTCSPRAASPMPRRRSARPTPTSTPAPTPPPSRRRRAARADRGERRRRPGRAQTARATAPAAPARDEPARARPAHGAAPQGARGGAIELRAVASGRAVRVWSRTLAPGTHRLELWVPVVRVGNRYRVEFEAGTSASDPRAGGRAPALRPQGLSSRAVRRGISPPSDDAAATA